MSKESTSHRSAGACSQNSSSEDEEGGNNVRKRKRRSEKKFIKEQRFVIHPNNLCATLSELHEARRRNSTTIPLDDNKTETEIRTCLVAKLPQLTGKSFKFFTKDEKHGSVFCPCSLTCTDTAHRETPAEWNGKTIKKMARGHKVVYIYCQQEGEEEEEEEKENEEDLKLEGDEEKHNMRSGNDFQQKRAADETDEGRVVTNTSMEECSDQNNAISASSLMCVSGRPVRGEFLPELATKTSLNDEEITDLVNKVSLEDKKERNTFVGLLVTDGGCTRRERERTPTPLNSIVPDSAYHSGSTTTIFPGSMDTGQRSERAPMLSPLVATGHMENPRNQEQIRTMLSVKIDEIVPTEGTVEGGYNFLITLDTAMVTFMGQLQVMFGDIPADLVKLTGDKDQVKGKVPQSPTTGVVQVKLLNSFGETISINTVPFEYTEQKDKYKAEVQKWKNYLDKEITSPQQCTVMASLVFGKMSELQSNSKGGTSFDGNSKTRALLLLRMIVESAAKVNAMELFIIIFSTSVGRNVFKSFKNEELSLEEIARENGHEELACFLEQRHLKYREDESDSDDEVDWASLAKATRNYQRQKGESTGSFEDSRDYNGDVEDSLSFLSESDLIVETFLEEPLDKSEKTPEGNCQEDPQTVIQEGSKDLTHENEHMPTDDQHAKSKNQGVGCLGLLVKFSFYDMKGTIKKVKEGVQIACVSKQSVTTKSSINVEEEEEHLAAFQVSEKRETRSAGEEKKATSIENTDTESSTTPCTSLRVNLDEEIPAAPLVLDELISRNRRKPKLLKRSSLLLLAMCASVFVALLYITAQRISPENNAAPQEGQRGKDVPHQIVNSSVPTAIATILNVNRSGVTNENVSKMICKSETASDCLRSCPADHVEVLNQDKIENDCFRCPTCFPGTGLSVPCGSIVGTETVIECKPCTIGITFSSSFDDACQNCSQCQRNETVVRPCRPSVDTVCARCRSDQNTWIDTEKEIYGCFDCPICSSGFEPSHPCGSVVPHGEMITCVHCQEGETFSTMTGREQCKQCSSCPRGQRIVISCTKYSDTLCGRNCGGDQVTLLKQSKNQTNVECIDCLMCPAGMEPSVACGAIVKNSVALRCVPCSPGLTYSDQRSKYGCKRCTECSSGKVITSHCSIHHDTVCSTRCSFNQITISNKSILTCVDCVICSLGMEPEISCGTSVNALPRQRCTPCKPGTFSSTYGPETCRPCQTCDHGTTAQRCTAISDTVCVNCGDAFYLDPFILTCLPCSRCCNDGKDFYPRDCRHLQSRQCQARTCLSNSSHFNYSLFHFPPRVRSTRSFPNHISVASCSSCSDARISFGPSSRFSALFVLTGAVIAFVLLMLSMLLVTIHKYRLHTTATLRKTETRTREATGEITLEELDAKHMELFESMCSKLDGRRGFRRDYERLATKYDRINVEQRAALRCEQDHGGSPSRLLMLQIQTLYPNLPLRYLVHSLKEIGRNDIATRLTELILEGNYGVSRSIEELSTLV